MLMKSLYLQARVSTSAKPLLNITRAVLKRAFFTAWWPKTSSPFWPGNRSADVWFPGLWNANCARFLIAVFWREVLCGFTAIHAAWIASFRIRANIEAFVRRVAAGAWPIRRPISWTMYFPKSRCGSGCCLFPFALRYRLAYDSSLVRDVAADLRAHCLFLDSPQGRHCRIKPQSSLRRRRLHSALQRCPKSRPPFPFMALDGIYIDDSKGESGIPASWAADGCRSCPRCGTRPSACHASHGTAGPWSAG